MSETLRSEWVKCGNRRCGKCPHGPYWYAYWKEGGKTRKRYVGKGLPGGDTKDQVEREQSRLDDIFNDRKATPALAWEIMGMAPTTDRKVLFARYRRLMLEHEPDRYGDRMTCSRINSAYAYLRRMLGGR